jgi:AcrR family transcriptional regulator
LRFKDRRANRGVYVVHMAEPGTAERIAAAALEILVDEGAKAVTMRRVAAAAGVTAMATYRHYPNRDALLRSVADTAFAEIGADWAARGAGGDFAATMDVLADAFLDFALGKPNLYLFMIVERLPDARQFPDGYRDSPTFAPAVAMAEQGIREGVLREDDPLEVAVAITMPIVGLVQLYHGNRISMPEAEFRALCKRTLGRVIDGLRN